MFKSRSEEKFLFYNLAEANDQISDDNETHHSIDRIWSSLFHQIHIIFTNFKACKAKEEDASFLIFAIQNSSIFLAPA